MIPQWKVAALGALGGAVLAVLVVFVSAALGMFPRGGAIDGPKLQAYLLSHPSLVTEMMQRASEEQDAAEARAQALAFKAIPPKAFFDPKLAFVTGPVNAKAT